MSEAELYLIRQRMLSGKLAKAERGELAVPLPIGYVRRPSGEVVLDPDEQAQHVVRLVFGTFRRLGTLNAVLRYLVGARGPAAGPGAFRAGQGGARVAAPDPGDAADTCCTTRSTPGITPTAAARSSRAGRSPAGRTPGGW